jgi:SAM-dependent methyltransferase
MPPYQRVCPICGYRGFFLPAGIPPRTDAECPSCQSRERHRLLYICHKALKLFQPHLSVLHFAPEHCISGFLADLLSRYDTADIDAASADMVINIEDIKLPDMSYDIALVLHVLEHVDDLIALRELHRILKPNGKLLAMVPIIEGWDVTYEDSSITDPSERALHFGQHNHVRYYGRDFRDRLRKAGFTLSEFVATGSQCVDFGLIRGERVFIGTKNAGYPMSDGDA